MYTYTHLHTPSTSVLSLSLSLFFVIARCFSFCCRGKHEVSLAGEAIRRAVQGAARRLAQRDQRHRAARHSRLPAVHGPPARQQIGKDRVYTCVWVSVVSHEGFIGEAGCYVWAFKWM